MRTFAYALVALSLGTIASGPAAAQCNGPECEGSRPAMPYYFTEGTPGSRGGFETPPPPQQQQRGPADESERHAAQPESAPPPPAHSRPCVRQTAVHRAARPVIAAPLNTAAVRITASRTRLRAMTVRVRSRRVIKVRRAMRRRVRSRSVTKAHRAMRRRVRSRSVTKVRRAMRLRVRIRSVTKARRAMRLRVRSHRCATTAPTAGRRTHHIAGADRSRPHRTRSSGTRIALASEAGSR